MSEQEERKEEEYIHKFIGALDKAKSSLSEIGLMELRRKKNTVGAIIGFVRPMFYENLSMQKELEARNNSRAPFFGLCVFWVVGIFLEHLVGDTIRLFDFNIGPFVIVCGYVIWLIYNWNTERMERKYYDSQQAINEMLYRWIANGGAEFRFWKLCDQVDVGTGNIDMGGHKYIRWWYESEGDLVDNINGQSAGLGLCRP
jgi:hypothetical protein